MWMLLLPVAQHLHSDVKQGHSLKFGPSRAAELISSIKLNATRRLTGRQSTQNELSELGLSQLST